MDEAEQFTSTRANSRPQLIHNAASHNIFNSYFIEVYGQSSTFWSRAIDSERGKLNWKRFNQPGVDLDRLQISSTMYLCRMTLMQPGAESNLGCCGGGVHKLQCWNSFLSFTENLTGLDVPKPTLIIARCRVEVSDRDPHCGPR